MQATLQNLLLQLLCRAYKETNKMKAISIHGPWAYYERTLADQEAQIKLVRKCNLFACFSSSLYPYIPAL